MGALTSKPQAFHSRPWELQSVNSYDFNDALMLAIRLDLRSNTIMRVIPRLDLTRISRWIPDKTRFFFDGLRQQRLALPFFNIKQKSSENITAYKTSWVFAFKEFARFFVNGKTQIDSLLVLLCPFPFSNASTIPFVY